MAAADGILARLWAERHRDLTLPIANSAVADTVRCIARAADRTSQRSALNIADVADPARPLAATHPLALALSGYSYASAAHETGQRFAAEAFTACLGSDVGAVPSHAVWRTHDILVHDVAGMVEARILALVGKIVPRDATWEDASRLAYAIRFGQHLVTASSLAFNFLAADRVAPALRNNAVLTMPATAWIAAARLAHQLRGRRPAVGADGLFQCAAVCAA